MPVHTSCEPAAINLLTTAHGQLFLLRRGALGGLQRIHRTGAAKSTTFSGRLLGLRDHNVTVLWPWHRAFHHQQVLVLVHAQHAQVTNGHAIDAHVPRHAHAFKYTRGESRRADRTGDLEHGAVRGGAPGKLVALHHARETTALAGRNHIHEFVAVENVHQNFVADLGAILIVGIDDDWHLTQEAHRRKVVLGEVALHRLRQPRLLHELHQPDLSRVVAIFGYRLALRHKAGTGLQHVDRVDITLVIEELRHANLLAQNSTHCHLLVLNSAS